MKRLRPYEAQLKLAGLLFLLLLPVVFVKKCTTIYQTAYKAGAFLNVTNSPAWGFRKKFGFLPLQRTCPEGGKKAAFHAGNTVPEYRIVYKSFTNP